SLVKLGNVLSSDSAGVSRRASLWFRRAVSLPRAFHITKGVPRKGLRILLSVLPCSNRLSVAWRRRQGRQRSDERRRKERTDESGLVSRRRSFGACGRRGKGPTRHGNGAGLGHIGRTTPRRRLEGALARRCGRPAPADRPTPGPHPCRRRPRLGL